MCGAMANVYVRGDADSSTIGGVTIYRQSLRNIGSGNSCIRPSVASSYRDASLRLS